MRIALFGGTFDPFHNDHKNIVLAALKYADKVVVMPNFVSPFKESASASGTHRFNIASLALQGIKNVEVSDYELKKGEVSYTVDTLKAFSSPENELFFVLGGDSMCSLQTWHCAEIIAKLAKILVVKRESVDNGRLSKAISAWENEFSGQAQIIGAAGLLSSSDIRMAYSFGYSPDGVSRDVDNYILKNGLYKTYHKYTAPLAGFGLSAHRIKHTYGVAVTAEKLAKRYGGDVEKCIVAAILHDIAKNTDEKKARAMGVVLSGDLSDVPKPCRHAYIGADIARQVLKIEDSEILDAVKYHTTCRPDMTLTEQITAVADYVEPFREYTELESMRKCAFEDLDICTLRMLKHSLDDINRRNLPAHKLTQQAIDYMEKKLSARI